MVDKRTVFHGESCQAHRQHKAASGATYTFKADDVNSLVKLSHSSGITATVPLDSAMQWEVGDFIDVLQAAAGAVTVSGENGTTDVTVRVNALYGAVSNGQYSVIRIMKIGANEVLVTGELDPV